MSTTLSLAELEALSRAAGFVDYRSLLYELYVVHHLTMVEISKRCHIHWRTTRKHLVRFGVPIYPSGGVRAQDSRIHLTSELVGEVLRDGIPAVAARLGVLSSSLASRMKAWSSSMKP
jgi:hypothetical protein